MSLVINKISKRGPIRLVGYAVSEETGRVFSVEFVAEDEESEARLRGRVERAYEQFLDIDKKITETFNVTVKKVLVSLDDISHMTEVEMSRLLSEGVLCKKALSEAARAHGFTDDFEGGEVELYRKKLESLLKKNPSFMLGALSKKSKTVSRLKSHLDPSDFVDRKGYNGVLKDGTIIGEPVMTKKIESFLKALSDRLETAKDYSEARLIKDKLLAFCGIAGPDVIETLSQKIRNNPVVEEGRYSSDPKKIALSDQMQEFSLERRQATIASLVDAKEVDELIEEDVVGEFKSLAFDYVNALNDQGGHICNGASLDADLMEYANECVKEINKAQEGAKEFKPAVIGMLERENKPLTERRLQVAAQKYLKDTGLSSNRFFYFWRGQASQVFKEQIRLDAEKQLAKKAQKKRVSFSAKRIKKPETARDELLARKDLNKDDRTLLVQCAATDPKVLRSLIKSAAVAEDSELLQLILFKAGAAVKRLTKEEKNRWSQKDDSYIIECFIAAGIADVGPWHLISSVNVVKIADHAPAAQIMPVIDTLLRTDCDEDIGVLERALEKIGDLDKEQQKSLAEDMQRYLSRVSFKPLRIFQNFAATKTEAFDRINELSAAGDDGLVKLTTDQLQKALLRPDLSLYYFGVFDRQANVKAAARFLRAAVKGAPSARVESHLDACSSNFSGDISCWKEVLSDQYIVSVPEYAAVLIPSMIEHGVQAEGSWRSDVIDLLTALFSAGSVGDKQAAGIVGEIYGKGSETFRVFARKAGSLDPEEIVKDILAGAKEEAKNLATEYANASSWNKRPDVFRRRHERLYVLEPHNISLFDKLCLNDPRFANLANITKLSPEDTQAYEAKVMQLVADRAADILEAFRHHAHYPKVTRYFSLFVGHPELAVDAVLSSEITPKQAIAVARGLSESCRSQLQDRFLALVDKNHEAREEMRELFGLGADLRDQSRKNQNPAGLARRVVEGDKNLTESEWQRLFDDDKAAARVCLGLDEKDLSKICDFAQTFGVDLTRIIRRLVEHLVYNGASRNNTAGLSHYLARLKALLSVLSEKSEHGIDGLFGRAIESVFYYSSDFLQKTRLTKELAEALGVRTERWAELVANSFVDSVVNDDLELSEELVAEIAAGSRESAELKVALMELVKSNPSADVSRQLFKEVVGGDAV